MDEIRIGTVLKNILNKNPHLTLKKMSKETAIPYSTLYSWSENRTPKDIIKLYRLSNYLNIELEELLFDKKKIKKESPTTNQIIKGFFEIEIKRSAHEAS